MDDSYSQRKISELFFLDPGSINRWLQKYKEGRIDLLIADSREEANLYHKAKDIGVYIKKTFGVEYSESGITTLLNRLDFVYKKTKGVPGKAKKEDQLKFIKKLCLKKKEKE